MFYGAVLVLQGARAKAPPALESQHWAMCHLECPSLPAGDLQCSEGSTPTAVCLARSFDSVSPPASLQQVCPC